ncbi:MAG: hypothetical protein V3V59_08975 [Thermodesulfovibrionales bacterium]
MKCPYLKGGKSSGCNAQRNPYLPSWFELQEYCKTTQAFKKCPFYRINTDKRFILSKEVLHHLGG